MLVTRKGLSLRFHEEQVRADGPGRRRACAGIRPAQGRLRGRPGAGQPTTRRCWSPPRTGIGKRTPFDDYRVQSRGGKGIITMKVTEKTGEVVGALAVPEDDELMLMTTGGQSVRIRATEVRETGRNTQGVKLLTLADGELLQDIARVIPDDEEDGGDGEDVETGEAGD